MSRAVFVALALALASPTSFAFAAPPSLEYGAEQLSRGDYEQALADFLIAQRVDPRHRQISGSGGRGPEPAGSQRRGARAARTRALARGRAPSRRGLSSAAGHSCAAALYLEAVESLQAYEAARPGRAQTAEFLGRAFLGLGDFARAEEQLEEALRRDPQLSSTSRAGARRVRDARKPTPTALR